MGSRELGKDRNTLLPVGKKAPGFIRGEKRKQLRGQARFDYIRYRYPNPLNLLIGIPDSRFPTPDSLFKKHEVEPNLCQFPLHI